MLRRGPALLFALLLAATAAAFAGGFRNGWTSADDDTLVLWNPAQRRFGAKELREALDPRASRRLYGHQYTPLSDLSYALDRKIFGERAGPYHLQPLLFHLAAAAAVFALARRLGATPVAAFVAGAVFALHPCQVNSVTWISGRRTAIAGALVFFAALAWARARGPERSRAAYAASLVFALLANLAKQSAVITFPVCVLVDWALPWRAEKKYSLRKTLLAMLPHAAISIAFVALGIWVGRREGIIAPHSLGPAERIQLVFVSAGEHLRLFLWPSGLQPLYRTEMPAGWLDRRVLAGAVLALAAAGALALFLRKRAVLVSFGIALFAVALAPNVHAMGTQVVADRYLYASLAGAGIAAAGAIRAIERRDRSLALLLGSGLAAVLFTLTVFRVPVWRDDVTLFGDAVTSDPLSGIMHRYYGRALAEAGRLEEGEWELRRAAVLLSAPAARGRWLFPIVLGEIALICETRGDLAEARALHAAAFTAAGPLEIDVAAVAYATFLEHRGEIDEARRVLREALARAKADAPKVSARLLELDGQKP